MVGSWERDGDELQELPRAAVVEAKAVPAAAARRGEVLDDDRLRAIGGEVEVVWGRDADGLDRPLGTWIDDGQRVAVHVIDVQELEIPVRRDVLWQAANSEAADDPEGGRINDDHVAGSLIGNVDPWR